MPTRGLGGAKVSLCRLEAEAPQGNGWHEPYELRGSCTDLWGTGGEIPPVYPATEGFDTADLKEAKALLEDLQ